MVQLQIYREEEGNIKKFGLQGILDKLDDVRQELLQENGCEESVN